jgi:sugar/nucleoside kinase (ribokinase family)
MKEGEVPPRLAARGFTSGGLEVSLSAFFAALRELGPRYVVVTDGRDGAYVDTPDTLFYCPVLETQVAAPRARGMPSTRPSPPMWRPGARAEDALRAAAINAASVVGHIDTQTGLLHREAH